MDVSAGSNGAAEEEQDMKLRRYLLICLFVLNAFFLCSCGKKDTVDVLLNNQNPDEMSDDEAENSVDEAINKILDHNNFANLSETEQVDVVGEVLELMAEENLVGNVQYDDIERMYSFEYRNGTLGGVLLRSLGENTLGTGYNAVGMNAEQSVKLPILQQLLYANVFAKERFEKRTSDTDLDVQILYGAGEEIETYYNDVYDFWSEYDVNINYNNKCTLEDLRNMQNHDVYIITMHGARYNGQTALVLDEEVKLFAYMKDRLNKTVVKLRSIDGRYYYLVLPSFFRKNYSKTAFDNSVMAVLSCEFYGSDKEGKDIYYQYSQTFLDLSAEAVFGFRNTVYADYAVAISNNFVESLLAGNNVNEAFEQGIEKYGEKDKHLTNAAYPIISGNGEYRIAYRASNESEDGPSQNELSEMELYEPVIEEYREIVETGEYPGYDEYCDNRVLYVDDEVTCKSSIANYAENGNWGYLLYDVNDDDKKELLIGEISQPYVWAMYTIRNGKVVNLFYGWERNTHMVYVNGIILGHGSNGAADSKLSLYLIENEALYRIMAFYFKEDSIYLDRQDISGKPEYDDFDINNCEEISRELEEQLIEEVSENSDSIIFDFIPFLEE